MDIKTDEARAAETTPRHVVLKMLLASTALAVGALTLVANLS